MKWHPKNVRRKGSHVPSLKTRTLVEAPRGISFAELRAIQQDQRRRAIADKENHQ